MKKSGKRIVAWLLSATMVLTIIFQWGVPALGGENAEAAELIDLSDDVNQSVTIVVTKDHAVKGVQYTGSELTPAVTVKVDGVILSPECYTCEYTNNINVTSTDSMAQVIVTGVESAGYTGQAKQAFKIYQASISTAKVTFTSDTYKSGGKWYVPYVKYYGNAPMIESVVWNGMALKEGSKYDYIEDCVLNGDEQDAGTQNKTTISGRNNFTGSVTINWYVAQADINDEQIIVSNYNYVYDGTAKEPAVTMYDLRAYDSTKKVYKQMEQDVDYTVTYKDNVNPGTASVVVEGINNYKGTKTINFTISDGSSTLTDLSSATVSVPKCIYNGAEQKPDLTITCGGKTLQAGTDYTVTYTNNTYAGTAKATISGIGNYTGTKSISFPIEKRNLSNVTLTAENAFYFYGSSVSSKITLYDEELGRELVSGTDYKITSSDIKEVGNHTITAQALANSNYTGTCQGTLIVKPLDVSDIAVVTPQEDSYTYTGSAITPQVEVIVNGRTLTEGTDYTLSYQDNVEPGNAAKVVATFQGNYTGSATGLFTIDSPLPNLSDAEISEIPDQVYTGGQIKPTITVSYNGTLLTENEDYTLSYGTNRQTGLGTVTITGNGTTYYGTKTCIFNITTRDINTCRVEGLTENQQFSYTGQAIEPEVRVYCGDNLLEESVDYAIYYYGNTVNAGGLPGVLITAKGSLIGTYKIPYTITGITMNGATVVLNEADYTYDGMEKMPAVKSLTTADGIVITDTSGLDLTYSNNINAGTATVKIKPSETNKNLTDSTEAVFTIKKKTLSNNSDCVIAAIPAQKYTGFAITPEPVLTVDGRTLVKDTDYTVSYSNNTTVGTATVLITGKNNYDGSLSKTFEIADKSLNNAKISVSDQTYTGFEICPAIKVTVDGETLSSNYYDVVYSNNKNAGTATVTITGKNGYSGTIEQTFRIKTVSIAECTTNYNEEAEWTGSAVEPAIALSYGGYNLVQGTDYEVQYANNISVGTATVTITGIGNYTGTMSKTFTISAAEVTTQENPTENPTEKPTENPQKNPTENPSENPTENPQENPTENPSENPTENPQENPTENPTEGPTENPTQKPTQNPTEKPMETPVVTPTVKKPGKVKGVKAKSIKTTSAVLHWKKVSGASGYLIYYKNPSTGKMKLVKTTGAKTLSYKTKKLKSATKYTYKIYAYKLSGKTKVKGTGTSYTFVTKPGTVKKVKAVSKKKKTASISWKKTKGASGYVVYMATSKKGKYKKIAQTKKTFYTKTKLKKGKTYYFKVKAYKTYKGKKTYSAYSKVVKVRIKK